ncbi:menaquinone-dependent protoporphyrinogen IX dehydrogenase [Shewanella sp. OMA3-2]|uniref:menaquinone-dependent protoporphyrinogen IX dehydrogenase n=1 Tax=Shewanella sp. OMA3-2 TaxID=2908650 RepID=UPI001F316AB5|nr:menaquinone-dependent protoporphyrinogen IX dehydrogenase [Shewanella sp. OMA3-2]UJF21633.1 menaquinone-dependent protoporphyrinogen IX dehydrogenase [Shewanella sp. OMA3-2]
MTQILLIYSSVHGQTRKICEYIKQKVHQADQAEHYVTLAALDDVDDLSGFDSIYIGASIRHGKHRPALYEFIQQHQVELETKPSGFFSVSLVARKPNKNTPETNAYMQAFLQKILWQPALLQTFAGNLDYQGYGVMDRHIIRFIMWITKGPTDLNTKVEYTDWQKVDDFIAKMIEA